MEKLWYIASNKALFDNFEKELFPTIDLYKAYLESWDKKWLREVLKNYRLFFAGEEFKLLDLVNLSIADSKNWENLELSINWEKYTFPKWHSFIKLCQITLSAFDDSDKILKIDWINWTDTRIALVKFQTSQELNETKNNIS